MKFLLTTFVFLSAISSYATDAGTRGGGNALICFNDATIPAAIRKDKGDIKDEYISSIKSIQMLDIYEVSLQQGMGNLEPVEFTPIKKGESISAFAERMITRTKDFAPELYQQTMEIMKTMPPEKSFAHPYGIENVRDFDLMGKINSRLCVVGTILYHVPQRQVTEIHYDQRLWSHPSFDTYNKYVAYLHEVVYRTWREVMPNTKDSDAARKFVGILLKKNFDHDLFMRYLLDSDHWMYRSRSSAEQVVEFRTTFSELAYGKPAVMIANSFTWERLSYNIDTYAAFYEREMSKNPLAKKYFAQKAYGIEDQFKASLTQKQKQELGRILTTDLMPEYKKYLLQVRIKAFADAAKWADEYLKQLEQVTYYSPAQKKGLFAEINKYLNQTQEDHMKVINNIPDLKTASERQLFFKLFENVKINLRDYYPLEGQF